MTPGPYVVGRAGVTEGVVGKEDWDEAAENPLLE